MSKRALRARLRVIAWNVYIGHKAEHVVLMLKQVIKEQSPDVIFLTEAGNLFGDLGDLGYEVIQLRPHALVRGSVSETANIAMLVRPGVKASKKRALRMKVRWSGPKHGLPHDPRVYRSAVIEVDGVKWKVGGFHLPFGQAARDESDSRIVRWFNRTMKRRPVIAVGDMNMRLADLRDRIADKAKAKVAGAGIDLTAFKRCRLVDQKDLGKRGSDHPMKLYVYEARV
jgi:endonuclease/exonuclease/phosphatase family metal-dependent hydrolase